MISAQEGLQRLVEGNRRFIERTRDDTIPHNDGAAAQLPEQQAPFAIIVGCSDSRVPAELVFDQGLGDLFVIRVAGNIATPTQIGSVEFAALQFGTPLVVVLGHSRCGAVSATLQQLQPGAGEVSPALQSIVDQISPAVESLLNQDAGNDELMELAVRANIQSAAAQLCHGSAVISGLIDEKKLMLVTAEYSLDSGEVIFFNS